MNTEIIAFHNQQLTVLRENEESYIAVKPICQALGVGFSRQRRVINNDPILAPVVALGATTGADNKQYEMLCIPVRYVFGWLFMIHPGNVKEEARDKVIQYRRQCYDLLYDYFINRQEAIKKKEKYLHSIQEEIEQLTHQRKGHWPYDQGEEGGV